MSPGLKATGAESTGTLSGYGSPSAPRSSEQAPQAGPHDQRPRASDAQTNDTKVGHYAGWASGKGQGRGRWSESVGTAASHVVGEIAAVKRLRVIVPRIGRSSSPADVCHSNKYPLWVSALVENGRSIRSGFRGVNRQYTGPAGFYGCLQGMFRKGCRPTPCGRRPNLFEAALSLAEQANKLAKIIYKDQRDELCPMRVRLLTKADFQFRRNG